MIDGGGGGSVDDGDLRLADGWSWLDAGEVCGQWLVVENGSKKAKAVNTSH